MPFRVRRPAACPLSPRAAHLVLPRATSDVMALSNSSITVRCGLLRYLMCTHASRVHELRRCRVCLPGPSADPPAPAQCQQRCDGVEQQQSLPAVRCQVRHGEQRQPPGGGNGRWWKRVAGIGRWAAGAGRWQQCRSVRTQEGEQCQPPRRGAAGVRVARRWGLEWAGRAYGRRQKA